MDRNLMKKLAMAARVQEFVRAQPFSDRNQAAVGRRLEERLAEAHSLFLKLHDQRVASSAEAQHRQALRAELALVMRTVAKIGQLSLGHDARLVRRFHTGWRVSSNAAFIAEATSLLEIANEHQDVLIRSGLLRSQLAAFVTGLAEYRKVMAAAPVIAREIDNTGRALRAAVADLDKIVRMLDVFQHAHFAGDAELLAAWTKLRVVATRVRKSAGEVVVENDAPTVPEAIAAPVLPLVPKDGVDDPLPGDGGRSNAA